MANGTCRTYPGPSRPIPANPDQPGRPPANPANPGQPGQPAITADLANLEPWLPGCRVLPGRVGQAGCRVGAGTVPGCRVPVRCRVQPGAAGCCWVLPQAVRMCCHFQVLPGAARLPVCRVRLSGSCRGCVLAAGPVAHHETHLRERSLSDW